jgi:hypothetical protein
VNGEQCNGISNKFVDGGCLWILGNDSSNDAKPYCINKVYVYMYQKKRKKKNLFLFYIMLPDISFLHIYVY